MMSGIRGRCLREGAREKVLFTMMRKWPPLAAPAPLRPDPRGERSGLSGGQGLMKRESIPANTFLAAREAPEMRLQPGGARE